MRLPSRCSLLLLLLLSALTSGRIAATEDAGLRSELAVDIIKSRAEEMAASVSLEEATKAMLQELYRKAIGSLSTAAHYRTAAQDFEAAVKRAADEAARLRAEVEQRSAQADPPAPELRQLPLAEIEQRLLADKAELTSIEARVAELRSEIDKQQNRPASIRQRLGDANVELTETPPDAAAPGDETPELLEARRWAREARLEELRAEVAMLGQEMASQPMRLDLLQAEQDLAVLEQKALQQRVQHLERVANRIRLEQTEQAKIEAQVAELVAADKHPLVAELASRNTDLSKEIEALAGEIDGLEREERQVAEQARGVEEDFIATRKKIEVAGVSQILGQVLQEQRRSLPDLAQAKKKARLREKRIAEAALSQILLEEERAALRDVPAYVAQLSRALPVRAQLEQELTELARSRQGLVDQAMAVQRRYLQVMGELDIAQRRLAAVVGQFDTFLDERLLWVRSSQAASWETMRLIPDQLVDLFRPPLWREVSDILSRPESLAWLALVIPLAVGLQIRRRRLARALRDSGGLVGNLLRDRLLFTVQAFGIIALMALPIPLLLLAAGWSLYDAYDAGDFSKHVGRTGIALAFLGFQLRALRLFVAPHSIAAAHFGWREAGLRRLHRDLRWFSPPLIAAGGLTMLSFATTTQHWGAGLGRAAFVLVMLLVAVFFHRFARPKGGTLSVLLGRQQDGAPFRLRHLWYVLLAGSPLIAAAVSLAGYMYTAGTLMEHIIDTVWFALLVIVLHQFAVRWLVLNQSKLRLQAARERRRAEREARDAEGHPEETEGVLARDLDEPAIDLNALDVASRKLTNNAFLLVAFIGAWLIWGDMLPALRILDEVTLWSYSKPGVDTPIPITLSSLGLAVLLFAIMLMAVRQLPAFLEITLLQRLDMSQGSRYTVVTLTKYTIVAIGVAWIFGILGGSWSEIQWIFAALGVGIGFGLQEIVANFISGLIILFERPIRVGDVVTVGSTDGVVTRIRIRATTIRNWDQKELLVPNKNFITQELLNWSLSDQTTRILVRLGVAYGSNVERALLIMEEVARDHPRVLSDPVPFAVFEEFGDNALLLSLRCYIDNIDFRLRTITDLNLAINRALAEAGIEIAFPQRDVHLATGQPLDVRIRRARPEGEV